MTSAAPLPSPASPTQPKLVGDIWGGVASTLVAIPASIAFGVAIYGAVGGNGVGAMAGLLGATALGIVAPLVGGTPRLISAPCAPAVAVMSAFALQMASANPGDPLRVLILMTLIGLVAAAFQIAFGLVRAGTMIKYIPYPVVTGYLSGVGVVIFLKQLPALLGLGHGVKLGHALTEPALWHWPAIVVGAVTILAMATASKLTKAVPPAILGLLAGVLTYVALATFLPSLRSLKGNNLVIGKFGASASSLFDAIGTRLGGLGKLHLSDIRLVVGPALTLAVLLSLDTLKTCVVVDAMTGSRHESNRELFGQGVANSVSAIIGGMPGAGTSGATLVNIASGAQTRWSGVIEGALVLFAFLFLSGFVAWAPLAALAGILVVVAVRMFDWGIFRWARSTSTGLDFAVVMIVIAVAVGVDLISASAVGVALSIILFIRNESRAPVIRRKLYGNKVFSKQRRLPEEMEVLTEHGEETLLVQLAGSLFFGTTDELRTQLQQDLEVQRTILFDLRSVDAVDLTAVHIFEQMSAQLQKRGATMAFCNPPRELAGQKDSRAYLEAVGLITPERVLFEQQTEALAWVENRILKEHGSGAKSEVALELLEMAMFQGRKAGTVAELAQCVVEKHVPKGEFVFHQGDQGDEIYFVRLGTVRISLPIGGKQLHIASFGRGDFFGEITFLDAGQRTANAIAETDVELCIISRAKFDVVAASHPRLGSGLFSGIARVLALRLRQADREIVTLEES